MIDRQLLDQYMTATVSAFGGQGAHIEFAKFMCRCLSVVDPFFPEVGHASYEIAKKFWLEGQGNPEDLLLARTACWQYLDENGGSVEIQRQDQIALRALLCVLHADPDNEDFSTESVRWFADMLDRLGDFSEEVIREIKAAH